MATRTEIFTRALRKLAVIAVGETPSAEDKNNIETAYNSIYQALLNDGLVSWGSTEDIPLWAEETIASLLAVNSMDSYGITPDMIPQTMATAVNAERTLARQMANDYEPQTTQTESF